MGIVIIGLSLGLSIIGVLANLNSLGNSGALRLAILGFCGGGSMVLAHFSDKCGK